MAQEESRRDRRVMEQVLRPGVAPRASRERIAHTARLLATDLEGLVQDYSEDPREQNVSDRIDGLLPTRLQAAWELAMELAGSLEPAADEDEAAAADAGVREDPPARQRGPGIPPNSAWAATAARASHLHVTPPQWRPTLTGPAVPFTPAGTPGWDIPPGAILRLRAPQQGPPPATPGPRCARTTF